MLSILRHGHVDDAVEECVVDGFCAVVLDGGFGDLDCLLYAHRGVLYNRRKKDLKEVFPRRVRT